MLQNRMDMGVIKAAKTEDVAVRLTESAVFARAKSAIRLDELPPGQQAIKIIPSAMLGCGFIMKHSKTVSKGRAMICVKRPVK